MIIGLFIFQWILAGLIIFTTYMVLFKYKSIEGSLGMYTSTRVYKTKASIAFIDKIVRKYITTKDKLKDKMDLQLMIGTDLYKEYIGRFSYISVKNIATKTKLLMWGVILLEMLVVSIDGTAFENWSITMITLSILLTIIVEIFTIIKAISEQHQVVVMMVEDYLLNTYPSKIELKELEKIRSQQDRAENESKVVIEEKQMEGTHNNKVEINELSIEDIAKLIGIF